MRETQSGEGDVAGCNPNVQSGMRRMEWMRSMEPPWRELQKFYLLARTVDDIKRYLFLQDSNGPMADPTGENQE